MTFSAFDFEREELLFCNLHYHQIKLVLVFVAVTELLILMGKNLVNKLLHCYSNGNSERTKIAMKRGHCYRHSKRIYFELNPVSFASFLCPDPVYLS